MSDFVDYVRDQLRGFGPFTARAMFGGRGLYARGLFFGLIADTTLYLRTDERNRDAFTKRGLMPFKPWQDRSVVLKAYYPVPEDILEDPEAASAWARQALDAAQSAAAAQPPARRTLARGEEPSPRGGSSRRRGPAGR